MIRLARRIIVTIVFLLALATVTARAASLQLQGHRVGPVDVTPADFFDKQGPGKYFTQAYLI